MLFFCLTNEENLKLIKQLLLLNNYLINLINKQIENIITRLNIRDRYTPYIHKSEINLNKNISIPFFGQISK